MLFALVIFLVSGWFAVEELRYFAFGSTADATIVEAFKTQQTGRRGRSTPLLAIRYEFDDNGTSRTERDDVSLDWALTQAFLPEPGDKIAVQFLPGTEDKSRLKGHSRPLPVAIFVVALIGITGFAAWLWRHAYQQVHGPKRRPSRARL
jgi:hypothetical protein